MTTSEFLAWGLPSVLVPLPTSAAGHQEQNAKALSEAGAAVHLPQDGLSAATLWRELVGLMSDSGRRETMSVAALERSRPDAADRIAKDLVDLLPAPAAHGRGAPR